MELYQNRLVHKMFTIGLKMLEYLCFNRLLIIFTLFSQFFFHIQMSEVQEVKNLFVSQAEFLYRSLYEQINLQLMEQNQFDSLKKSKLFNRLVKENKNQKNIKNKQRAKIILKKATFRPKYYLKKKDSMNVVWYSQFYKQFGRNLILTLYVASLRLVEIKISKFKLDKKNIPSYLSDIQNHNFKLCQKKLANTNRINSMRRRRIMKIRSKSRLEKNINNDRDSFISSFPDVLFTKPHDDDGTEDELIKIIAQNDYFKDWDINLSILFDYAIPEKELLFNIFPGFLNIYVMLKRFEIKCQNNDGNYKYIIFFTKLDVLLQVIKYDCSRIELSGYESLKGYLKENKHLIKKIQYYFYEMFYSFLASENDVAIILGILGQLENIDLRGQQFLAIILTDEQCLASFVEFYNREKIMEKIGTGLDVHFLTRFYLQLPIQCLITPVLTFFKEYLLYMTFENGSTFFYNFKKKIETVEPILSIEKKNYISDELTYDMYKLFDEIMEFSGDFYRRQSLLYIKTD